jgi:hypothetical protein
MPTTPQPQRRAGSEVTDADLDVLLAGTADAAPGLRPVADILAALTAEASTGELAGEARALAAFRYRAGVPVPRRRARRRPARLTSRLGAKAGAALTAAAVVLGGTATAAFANALPAPIQRLAHDAFGAPTPVPPRHLPAHRGHPAPGKRGGPGEPVAHQARSTRGNPGDNGKHANPHGQGQGSGQGQPGNARGPGGGNPHKNGQSGNRDKDGQSGSPRALRRGGPPATPRRGTHPARPGPGTSQS